MKWYTEEETGILDHQPVQEKIDNPEEGNKECSSTSGHRVYCIVSPTLTGIPVITHHLILHNHFCENSVVV